MLVGERHDEAVEAVALQLLAKGGEAIGVAGHGGSSKSGAADFGRARVERLIARPFGRWNRDWEALCPGA
jgi:ABC-type microcin C transport system duplicated ATPase subunit YejF